MVDVEEVMEIRSHCGRDTLHAQRLQSDNHGWTLLESTALQAHRSMVQVSSIYLPYRRTANPATKPATTAASPYTCPISRARARAALPLPGLPVAAVPKPV